MPDSEKTSEQSFAAFRRDKDDFEALYANNVQFQPSEWDLRAIFGEVDFEDGRPFVQQHTSISLPWAQAKIMLYFLAVQIGAYEIANGKIVIPGTVLPPDPAPPEGELVSNSLARHIYEHAKKMHDMFVK